MVGAALEGPESDAEARTRARRALEALRDPEIPVLSLHDLGVIRSLEIDGTAVRVGVTPTYSGCPATRLIRRSITEALEAQGFAPVEVIEVLSPPWSSDDLTAQGRAQLEAYGIAPPEEPVRSVRALTGGQPRRCPQCHGTEVECVSEFGSTPCKALYRCRSCREPFDYFKCL
jgi:ring-1,2-phenylacetyl-CoA epoxidase subunit PaaD